MNTRKYWISRVGFWSCAFTLAGCGGGGGSSPAPSYTIGGTVSGLATGTSVGLANNGDDSIAVNGNSAFTFNKAIAGGGSYSVAVSSQPAGQTCTVSAGTGVITSANITNISIACAPTLYSVGGVLSGLNAGSSVVLQDNASDSLTLSTNGAFTFPLSITVGAPYSVTVGTQPTGQTCVVSESTGTATAANITNIRVLCPSETVLTTFPVVTVGTSSYSGTGGGVIQGSDGNFYGMTPTGGTYSVGTVFKVTPTGLVTTLWSFGGVSSDGQEPLGGLVQGSDGNFYGVTFYGGVNTSGGTVFRITPTGDETVLWNFGAANDGFLPGGNLIQGSDGNFYGTTASGGAYGHGTVFKITPSGAETVIWSFGATATDGQAPRAGVIQANDGAFYGTTTAGGTNNDGTVFKVTGLNTETVIWSFGPNPDGQSPYGNLLQASDGNFYGTTLGGGVSNGGVGFKVTPEGLETVLWSFDVDSGEAPVGGLIQGSDGALYGTTAFRGMGLGQGTVFRATLTGELLILWDGFAYESGPQAGVIQGSDGGLYGTTEDDGSGVIPTPQGVLFKIAF